MFNINHFLFVRIFAPFHKRKPVRVAWLDAIYSPIKWLHAIFYATINKHIYDLQFTGQIIYLEHVLNDRFDNLNRGIYIDNIIDQRVALFVFNKIEAQPPVYIYNKWNVNPYVAGERAAFGNFIYQANFNNTNQRPDLFPATWTIVGPRRWLKNKIEYYAGDSFIIYVPVAVVFDIEEMKALTNKYKLAGKLYSIITY